MAPRRQGPPFTKFGHRVLYLGADLNAWLDARRVEPRGNSRRKRDREEGTEAARQGRSGEGGERPTLGAPVPEE